jgi:single-strand DNA-binding protein
MSGDAQITFTGNAASDPDLRFTPGGHAVCGLAVAVNSRVKNVAGEWEDGPTTFFRVTAWRDLGENVAGSVARGDRVTVTGSLKAREYEAKDGSSRTSLDVEAVEVGMSLRFATAKATRATRGKPVLAAVAGEPPF